MREFKDEEGRTWRVALTCSALFRVKDTVTIDVDGTRRPFNLTDIAVIGPTIQALRNDYLTLADVLYCVLQAQVEAKGLTKDQFLDGLRGDSLAAAAKAMEQELVDFFPLPRRKFVALLAQKVNEAETQLVAQAEAAVNETTIPDLLGQSGMPSGKPPESSESTPESGHSENSLPPATAA